MLKVGVIGGGSISGFHIQPYLKNEGVELVALCDSNKQRLAEAGGRYGVTDLYSNYNELLQNREIDRVYTDYPHLHDDAFVKENLVKWFSE